MGPGPSPAASGDSVTTVKVANSKLGTILTDGAGATLYYSTADGDRQSACTGLCAMSWLPLREPATGRLTAAGLSGTLATAPRSDGAPQVTYNDRPLYTFTGDKKPGDVAGQGVDGVWFVAMPSLTDPDAAAEAPTPAAPPATPSAQLTPAPAPPAPAPPAPAPPTPAPPTPAPPAFNDHDADNAGGANDGDGNG